MDKCLAPLSVSVLTLCSDQKQLPLCELRVYSTSGINNSHFGRIVPSGWLQHCTARAMKTAFGTFNNPGHLFTSALYSVIMPGSASLGQEQMNCAPFCCIYIYIYISFPFPCKVQLLCLDHTFCPSSGREQSSCLSKLRNEKSMAW